MDFIRREGATLRFFPGLIPGIQGRNERKVDMYIQIAQFVFIQTGGEAMATVVTSIRLDTRLADEAARVLGAKSRTEAVHVALKEVVALKKFKNLMTKNAGKLTFEALGE
jgi:Arc/MetJ family transcription regulator